MDLKVREILEAEEKRQREGIELIASENFVSRAVLETAGSVLTNKYAEGYAGKRYYGGCEIVDQAEELAEQRICELFEARFANVQPHSGSSANMAVYEALLKPGDTILGMDLSQGGHLTHGAPVSFSGQHYRAVHYGLGSDELLDYDMVRKMAHEHRPQVIVAGASAYSRVLDFERFREIADEVGARLVVDMAHIAGLIAAGLHPNPVSHAHVVTSTTHKTLRGPRGGIILTNDEKIYLETRKKVFPGIQGGPLMHVILAKAQAFAEALTPEFKSYQKMVIENARALAGELSRHGFRPVSGGTDNHLVLIDLSTLGISGKKTEDVLGKAGITVNKNTIPKETRSPFITSGIRVGTPAVTSRGMKPEDMIKIAGWMARAVESRKSEEGLESIHAEVREFSRAFPLPSDKEREA